MELVLTFEGLVNPGIPHDDMDWAQLVSDTLLSDPRIDCDNRKPSRSNSFLGTLTHGVRGKLDLDFLFWFDGIHFWMYSWHDYKWEKHPGPCPFFNFQVTLRNRRE